MVAAGDREREGSLFEAVQGPVPKPALGPPHDTYAAVGLTLAGAAVLFFVGRARIEADALGWIGMIVSFAVTIAVVHYFQRAYGFASKGWGNVPTVAGLAAMFGFMAVLQFVPAALYAQIYDETPFGYVVTCLALPMLCVSILRAALGAAKAPQCADEGKPHSDNGDQQVRAVPAK